LFLIFCVYDHGSLIIVQSDLNIFSILTSTMIRNSNSLCRERDARLRGIPTEATFINDAGEITENGFLPNGDRHATLAIPCDENHLGIVGCDYSLVDSATTAEVHQAKAIQAPASAAMPGQVVSGRDQGALSQPADKSRS